jgi:hypothetical protein
LQQLGLLAIILELFLIIILQMKFIFFSAGPQCRSTGPSLLNKHNNVAGSISITVCSRDLLCVARLSPVQRMYCFNTPAPVLVPARNFHRRKIRHFFLDPLGVTHRTSSRICRCEYNIRANNPSF